MLTENVLIMKTLFVIVNILINWFLQRKNAVILLKKKVKKVHIKAFSYYMYLLLYKSNFRSI